MGACRAFANLLSYPREDLLALVDACLVESRAGETSPEGVDANATTIAQRLLTFRADAERLGLARLEEAYTSAFDLDPSAALSVGHHVFGETARRNFFMQRLAQMYCDAGVSAAGPDLPDDLPVILRYVDAAPAGPEIDDLVADAVVPALERVAEALARANHAYAPVVRALLSWLARRATPSQSLVGGGLEQ